MKKISQKIRHNQLLSFFAITFVVTWGFLLTLGKFYFETENPFAGALASWGVFGPAIAGILVTRIAYPGKLRGNKRGTFLAFGSGLLASTFVFSLFVLTSGIAELSPQVIVGLLAVSLAASVPPAFVIANVYSRNKALRSYLASLLRPRGAAIFYLIAITGPLFAGWLGDVISDLTNTGVYWRPPPFDISSGIPVLTATFLYQFFFGNTLGEEVGWRGFALPRLQARFNPLIASFVIGLFWFPWHLPMRWMNPDILPLVFYGLGFIPSSIFLTWIYNRTGGSILAVGLAHVASNLSGKLLFPISNVLLMVQLGFAAVMIITDRMWRNLPTGLPVVHIATPPDTGENQRVLYGELSS